MKVKVRARAVHAAQRRKHRLRGGLVQEPFAGRGGVRGRAQRGGFDVLGTAACSKKRRLPLPPRDKGASLMLVSTFCPTIFRRKFRANRSKRWRRGGRSSIPRTPGFPKARETQQCCCKFSAGITLLPVDIVERNSFLRHSSRGRAWRKPIRDT